MPASMSSAAPTPSPSAKHASLTSWQTIRPSTSPGASPTHSTWRPSEREERLGRARGGVGGGRAARQLDEPAERGGGEEAGRRALGVELGERRLVAQDRPAGRPAAAALVVARSVEPAAVDDERRDLVARRVLRVGDPPAGGLGRVAQLVGQRGPAADHDEARRRRRPRAGRGRAAGARRPRGTRTSRGRSCGRGRPRPPCARRASTGASAARRRTARRTTSRPRSRRRSRRGPCSSNGPMRKPPPRRQTRSTCSTVASPSCTSRSASRPNGRSQRLTRKPGPSAASITCRPIARPSSRVVSSAASPERSPATTSTSFMTGAGLKKCMPTTRSGPGTPAAISVTDSDDVLVASTQSSRTTSASARTARA